MIARWTFFQRNRLKTDTTSVTRFSKISLFWQNLEGFLHLAKGLFSIRQKFEPTLANILCYGANFNGCKLPKVGKSNLVVRSHWIRHLVKAGYWLFFLNGPTQASFLFIYGLFKQTIQFLQQVNVKNVMPIQYTAPGFEPTTFGTWVSSHDH